MGGVRKKGEVRGKRGKRVLTQAKAPCAPSEGKVNPSSSRKGKVRGSYYFNNMSGGESLREVGESDRLLAPYRTPCAILLLDLFLWTGLGDTLLVHGSGAGWRGGGGLNSFSRFSAVSAVFGVSLVAICIHSGFPPMVAFLPGSRSRHFYSPIMSALTDDAHSIDYS